MCCLDMLFLCRYNKFLIGEKHLHLPRPLLMTTFHFLFQFLLSTFLLYCACPTWAPPTRLSCRDSSCAVSGTPWLCVTSE